jgi:hypothetical protein
LFGHRQICNPNCAWQPTVLQKLTFAHGNCLFVYTSIAAHVMAGDVNPETLRAARNHVGEAIRTAQSISQLLKSWEAPLLVSDSARSVIVDEAGLMRKVFTDSLPQVDGTPRMVESLMKTVDEDLRDAFEKFWAEAIASFAVNSLPAPSFFCCIKRGVN